MLVTTSQALAWRLGRHLLNPIGTGTVADVVAALGAVPRPDTTAELSMGMRRSSARPGDLAVALDRDEVIKTYAFRGAAHLMTPENAGIYLALRASGRQWERSSWQGAYELTPDDWPDFREAVRVAVADGPLTRDELRSTISTQPRFRTAAIGLISNSDTLLKALMWQGDVCFGPIRDGQATVRGVESVTGWGGLAKLDAAGHEAVKAYFRTYGPATPEHVHYWLGEGLSAGRKALDRWLSELRDELCPVELEGNVALILEEDLEELTNTSLTPTVHLLPGSDQWVMGPGTADPLVIPPDRRREMTLGANFVLVNGVVAGTWAVKNDTVIASLFPESQRPDHHLLEAEVVHLAEVSASNLELVVQDKTE